jgi:hypothetical protein
MLRDNGGLTSEKANAFREAMKYVGGVGVPVGVGVSIFNNNKVKYY